MAGCGGAGSGVRWVRVVRVMACPRWLGSAAATRACVLPKGTGAPNRAQDSIWCPPFCRTRRCGLTPLHFAQLVLLNTLFASYAFNKPRLPSAALGFVTRLSNAALVCVRA